MARKFTKKELARLTEAGVRFEVDGREIVVSVTYEGKVAEDGMDASDIDSEATYADVQKVMYLMPGVGGFSTQWGGWHLRKDYMATRGDWNDPSSAHHY